MRLMKLDFETKAAALHGCSPQRLAQGLREAAADALEEAANEVFSEDDANLLYRAAKHLREQTSAHPDGEAA